MDPAILLKPRSDDAPSGENLEYDPVFVEMELAAQPGEETQIGDTVTEGHDPDYREVYDKALEVLADSHDLRAAVFMADAALHTQGLNAFADVTTYIRGCLEQYWDTCHPELDEDDDNDPTMRINAIQGLCGQPGGQSGPSPVYRSLRRAGLTDSRSFGKFSMRDIEIAEGVIMAPESMENVPDSQSVSAAFQDTDEDALNDTLEAIKRAEEDVRAISAVFDEQTPGQGPELDGLIKLLSQMGKHVASYAAGEAGAGAEDTGDAVEGDAEGGGPAPAGGGGGAVGAIRSPADVSNALDRIIDYYKRYEPSSPLPLLLVRAKRLVNADFMTIINDIAPRGLGDVNVAAGLDDD